MVHADPAIDLADYLKRVSRKHHDAFLVEMLGAEGSGLPKERIDELLEDGVLKEDQLTGFRVVSTATSVDPYQFAILLGQAFIAADPTERHEMVEWPLSRWAKMIDEMARKNIRESLSELQVEPTEDAIGVQVTLPDAAPDLPPELTIPPKPEPPQIPGGGGPPIPAPPAKLSGQQREAWIQARTRAGEYIRGLGNRVDADLNTVAREVWQGDQIAVEPEKDTRIDTVATVSRLTAEAVAEGWSAKKLAQELGKATQDYARDWLRIARTELQGAYNDGVIIDAVRTFGPEVTLVRMPAGSACPVCQRLFLKPDGTPRTWTAQQLVDNGTNVGKKSRDWKATIWPIHPHCRCDVVVVPPGFKLDKNGVMSPA